MPDIEIDPNIKEDNNETEVVPSQEEAISIEENTELKKFRKSNIKKLKKEQRRSKHGDNNSENNLNIKTVKKAVIPAAGFGTRFLPATKALPKEMLPIVNVPSIQHIVQECVDSGITEILIILGRGKSSIENHFDKSFELEEQLKKAKKNDYLKMVQKISKMANIAYVRQKEMRGSGWAVHYAKTFVGDEPFLVLFGDDVMYNKPHQKPVSKQLVDAYYETGKSILGVQKIMGEEIRKYGVVIPGWQRGKFTEVKGILEKPGQDVELPSRLTSLGRFLLTPDIFKILEHTPKKNDEVYLTDAMTIQAEKGGVVAYEFDGRRYDIGDREGFLEAQVEFGLRDPELKEKFAKYLKSINVDKV